MRLQHRRACTRGYTLIEMMIVIGIVALVATIGIPMFIKANENGRLRSATRETIGKLQAARQLSVMGQRSANAAQLPIAPDPNNPFAPVPHSPSMPNSLPSSNDPEAPMARVSPNVPETVVQAELRIESRTRIEIWTRSDQGTESLAQVVDFLAEDPNSQVTIVNPEAPATIRFKNGRKDSGSPNQIELADAITGKHTFVDVGVSGMRIRN